MQYFGQGHEKGFETRSKTVHERIKGYRKQGYFIGGCIAFRKWKI